MFGLFNRETGDVINLSAPAVQEDPTTAPAILRRARMHIADRAATYDQPAGERSMAATVAAFAAITGMSMTEEQGWLFMALLKAARSQQGNYKADNYEDFAAYAALAGEAACNERAAQFHQEP